MASEDQKTLFLVGPGFIGGSLLVKLQEARPDLKLHALIRSEDGAAKLRQLGITPVVGSLTDAALVAEWAAKSDVIIHTASADDEQGSSAIVDGLLSRPDKAARRAIYIHNSGNDELARSARGPELAALPAAEKTLSDLHMTDEQLETRIAPDAELRRVDGALRARLFNPAAEREHNVVARIMMPPLVYGVGAAPWRRTSIQTPMLASCMIRNGLAALPEAFEGVWNCVWVHDLVDQFVVLLRHLETTRPGQQTSHYVFPAEKQTFLWREHFDAVASELKRLGHPAAQKNGGQPKVLETREELVEFLGGQDNGYSEQFATIVWGKENSLMSPDLLTSLGFEHKGKGVVDSIINGKELEIYIKQNME